MVIESFNLGDTAFVNLNYQDEVLFLQLNGGEIWRSGATDLVLVGLDANGNTTTDESQVVSYMVDGYTGTPTNIFIPTTYNEKPITKIGSSAFSETTTIQKITISKNVKSIGSYAFNESTATILFEEGCEITELGESCFFSCSGLTQIPLGEGLLEIPLLAFNSCENLKNVTIPSTVGYIGTFTFGGTTHLEELTLKSAVPPAMASINSLYLSSDAKIYVPTSYIQIYKADEVWGFFESYMIPYGEIQPSEGFVYTGLDSTGTITTDESAIVSYMIGDGSSTDGNGYNGTDINVVMPETYNGKPITKIGDYAFRNNATITSVYMPNTITSISNYAFENCSQLRAINISESASYIAHFAFQNCSALKRIHIPAATTSFGQHVFDSCLSLANVTFDENTNLTWLGEYIFANCSSIQLIDIPQSIKFIETGSFANCSSLRNVKIPEKVIRIYSGAFRGCSSLGALTLYPTTPPTLDSTSAISTATTTIYVPYESLEAYQTATNWSEFADIMVAFGEPIASWHTVWTGSLELSYNKAFGGGYSVITGTATGVRANTPTRVSGTANYTKTNTFTNIELNYADGENGTQVVNDTSSLYTSPQYVIAPTVDNQISARVGRESGTSTAKFGVVITEIQQYY